jgi:hypothetical protein
MNNKEIKQMFYELSSSDQEKILEDLLQEHELKGEVQKQAAFEIQKSRNKKPCPHCK